MIDLHAHLAWGYDDGASDLDESLAIARLHARDGVTTVVATPHVTAHAGWSEPPTDLDERCAALEERLGALGIDLRVVPGAEIYLSDETPRRVAEGSGGNRPLGDSRYLLVEFSLGGTPEPAIRPIADLIANGWRPILAHAERFGAVQRRPESLRRLIELGVLLQVNAGSLLGEFGPVARQLGESLIEAGLVAVVATDAHKPWRRAPNLAAGRSRVAELVGWEVAETLTFRNPAAVLADRPITVAGDLSVLDSPQRSFLGTLLG